MDAARSPHSTPCTIDAQDAIGFGRGATTNGDAPGRSGADSGCAQSGASDHGREQHGSDEHTKLWEGGGQEAEWATQCAELGGCGAQVTRPVYTMLLSSPNCSGRSSPLCTLHCRAASHVSAHCAKRWSAVSDGGEDQGAEEAFMGEKKEESSRQFWKEPSRASGSSFSARPGPSRQASGWMRGYRGDAHYSRTAQSVACEWY